MVFIWSTISPCGMLFILAVVLFTLPSSTAFKFTRIEVGSTHNFTCPGDLTKNYTFKFYKKSTGAGSSLIKLDGRIKQSGNVLTILNTRYSDSGLYSCAVFDENENKIKESQFDVVTIVQVRKYDFKIFPEKLTTFVDVGFSVEFRCEYQLASAQFGWERQRFINGTKVTDFLPKDYITVRNDSTKSVEAYIIKRATLNDAGTYRCIVTERGEKRVTDARVLHVRKPIAPAFGKMKNIFVGYKDEDLRISLELKVAGSPTPNISCYRNDRLTIFCSGKDIERALASKNTALACTMNNYELTEHEELIIKSASFSRNDGMYKCEVSNVVGTDTVHFGVNITVAPKISNKKLVFYRERRKQAVVKCRIELANPRPSITWFQQDLPSEDAKHEEAKPQEDKWTTSPYESKLDFIGMGKYESSLTIPWNQGQSFYRCFAENSFGNHSRVFKFIRFGKGDEPFAMIPRKPVVINEGRTFTATCRVTKVIGTRSVFYKESIEAELKNDTRTSITRTQADKFHNLTIVLRNLTVNDSGTYRCSEKNANEYASVTLTVRALFPPKIVDLQNHSVEYEKDKEVTFFCNVTGNPFPKVQWFREGKPSSAKLVRPSCEGLESGYFYKNKEHTKLAICKPDITHTGSFTCVVRNHLGSDRKNVFLNVMAKPIINKPMSRIKKALDREEAYELPCEVKGNPAPLVQWILEDEKRPMTNESQNSSTLKIIKMDESYIGNYTCRAWNALGTTSRSMLELELKRPEKTPKSFPGGGMAAGTIVGIVVAIAVLIIMAFFVIILCYRRQQKKLLFYKHQYFLKTGDYAVDPNLTLNEQSMNLPYDSDWEFPFERLVLGERLGAGAFGEVYKAEAMGILALNPRDKSSIASKRRSKIRRSLRASQRPKKKYIQPDLTNAVVAVKTVKAQATESEIRDLAAELKLMIHIGEHKNIVNLLGACTTGRKLYVILEFCPHGNLLTFLRSKRDIYDSTWEKEVYDPEKEFTLIDIVGAAFQIAKGMDFLAGRKLIHRDLAARNILVADEYVMKISDFGLARDIYKNDVYVKTSSGMLPVKWMAVESLFDRVYTHQSDVWSFGVLLWEMMTLGGTPYPNLPAEQLLDYLNEGKRMPQPAKCPLEIYTIMRDCWREEPEERPTFSNLVEHLGRILERHMEKVNPYLHVEASLEEIEAAKEKEELLKSKSDYYLQPLLLSNKIHGFDSNAPLPTPPTDTHNEAIAPLPRVETKPSEPKMKGAGSYELLREETPGQGKVPLDNESGIGLDDMNNKHHEDEFKPPKKVESVV